MSRDHRTGEAAGSILATQHPDGTWGNCFHSMAIPTSRQPLTTEQALRRLYALGFTLADEPVRRAVGCMEACLRGERRIDGYTETTRNWALFTRIMLAAWIRVFDPDNPLALEVARQWVGIMENAYAAGRYDESAFLAAYTHTFGKPVSLRDTGFADFYHLQLLRGVLTPATEELFLEDILSRPDGIYYLYGKPLRQPPAVFASRETVQYLDALDVLSGYRLAREKLTFATCWLRNQADADGRWDLGPKAKDQLHLPLSDSWRRREDRIADCTEWISALLSRLDV